MSTPIPSVPPQRAALDLQAAREENAKNQKIIGKLFSEIDRQNARIDQLLSAKRQESDFRLHAEDALDKTRDRLQLAVNAAGLALWDWKGNSSSVFHTARWGEMIDGVAQEGNWTVESLLGRVHADDRATVDAFFRLLRSGTSGSTPQVVHYRIRTPHGWMYTESHGMVAEREAQGEVVRLMGTHADITQRKEQELALVRARERAEESSQVKGAFLANISHEIRTPLNALMGLTHLLMDSPLSTQQQRWLALIDKSSQGFLVLLNDVLDLASIESGKVQIESIRLDLHELLAELSDLYQEQAGNRSLRWALERAPNLPRFFQGDANRLRQVLLNLLSNALKFTPAGGQVTLLADTFKKSVDGGAACLRVQVKDTGIGIAPSLHASIFDDFVQAQNSTTQTYGGTGLGLSIAAKLTRLMGGEITLDSDLGKGSIFTVILPLVDEARGDGGRPSDDPGRDPATELASAATQLATRRFVGLQVLTVDDHPVNELLMQELLGRLGCQVLVARDAQQALAEWRRHAPRLVLMDVQMPDMNGLDATRALRALEAIEPRPRAWVIGVTANASASDRAECLAAGMDDYVSKPIRLAALLEALDTALAALNVA